MEQRPTKIVKNRDIPMIQEIPHLKQMILSLEKRKQWEMERAQNLSQRISPVSGGGGGARRIIDDAVAETSEMEENHGLLLKQYTRKLRKAERIIAGIRSFQMQTFVTMLYLDNVEEKAIMSVLHMSRWAFENARNAVENAENMEDVKWNDRFCNPG